METDKMDMMCNLFSKMQNNTTKIYGMCFEKLNREQISKKSATTTIATNFKTIFEKSEFYNHKQSVNKNPQNSPCSGQNVGNNIVHLNDDYGAAVFIVVVICFYSITMGFLLISNIKCKCVFNRKASGVWCFEETKYDGAYDAQSDEAKKTIHMIFNDSSKLLTSVVLPPSLMANYSSTNMLNKNNSQASNKVSTTNQNNNINNDDANNNTNDDINNNNVIFNLPEKHGYGYRNMELQTLI